MNPLKACRLANLLGYDPGLGMKRGLPIVNAVAKATTKAGASILIGIHEGVHNCGSPHTLISEFQVRNSGIILDSVARNYQLTPDGLFGTQSLYHDTKNPDDHVKFNLLNGLMTFEISKPSTEELRSMPIHWITANDKWQPSAYNDEGSMILPLHASNLQQGVGIHKDTDTASEAIPNEVFLEHDVNEFEDLLPGNDKDWDPILQTHFDHDYQFYFDPYNECKPTIGKAFHLTLDINHWTTNFLEDDGCTETHYETTMDGYERVDRNY